MLGKLFEPYVVHVLPHLLLCFGDGNQYVREVSSQVIARVHCLLWMNVSLSVSQGVKNMFYTEFIVLFFINSSSRFLGFNCKRSSCTIQCFCIFTLKHCKDGKAHDPWNRLKFRKLLCNSCYISRSCLWKRVESLSEVLTPCLLFTRLQMTVPKPWWGTWVPMGWSWFFPPCWWLWRRSPGELKQVKSPRMHRIQTLLRFYSCV